MPQFPRQNEVAAQAIASAAAIDPNSQVQVILFSGADVGELDVRRLNPTADLADSFRDVAQRFATQTARQTPVAYGPGRVPAAYEIAYLDSADVDHLGAILASVEAPIELELFDPESTQARSLRFYVVGILSPNGSWVHFLRAKGVTLRLRRTSKIAAVMRGATYDRLDEDPLLFDAGFDAIVSEGVVLITNQGAFQRALGFVEQARQLAAETIDGLTQQLEIANLADFTTAATSDINMVAKLRSIATKIAASPAYAQAMTTERIVAFATENNIEIDTEEIDGRRRLVFHPEPARRWRILKLLDDDYLHSQLTDLDYEVNSKSPLGRE